LSKRCGVQRLAAILLGAAARKPHRNARN
jgi:hypothetical protein